MKKMFMIALVSVAFLLLVRSWQTSESPTVVSNPVATGDRESKVMRYMSCLGFSTSTAAGLLKATNGDADKVLTMSHLAISGELSRETPLNERERACLTSSGL
jgi:hypothetical protein